MKNISFHPVIFLFLFLFFSYSMDGHHGPRTL